MKILDATQYAKENHFNVLVDLDSYENDFSTKTTLENYGDYAYDVEISGSLKRYIDRENNAYDVEPKGLLYVSLSTVYDEDGNEVEMTDIQKWEIEEILSQNIELEFQEE